MKKGTAAMLALVLACATLLAGMLGADLARDRRRLAEINGQLEASRAAWEDTAERKEKLQAEMKELTDALKEAKLTLEESTSRAEELQAEIDGLKEEIQALREGNSQEEPADNPPSEGNP